MKLSWNYLRLTCAIGMMMILILDTNTVKIGVDEGITLCLKVIIPSLFPFFVVSNYLCGSLNGLYIPGAGLISKLLHLPKGSEGLLMIGLLGGYPVGAQLISNAYQEGTISKPAARILLGYCSNAGPAFIFGVAASLFSTPRIALIIWMVHIVSAILTGYLLPKPAFSDSNFNSNPTCSFVQSLQKAIRGCVSVCGWVIIFKILLSYLAHILRERVGTTLWSVLSGILELTNGCVQLQNIENEAIRFLLCAFLLSFGGICVLFQTKSITGHLGLGLYIPGKITQSCISLMVSVIVLPIVFHDPDISAEILVSIGLICLVVTCFMAGYCKKRCGNFKRNHV